MDINDLSPEVLHEWIDTGQSKAMSEAMVRYVEQLDLARSLFQKYNTREFIIRTLIGLYPEISRHRANQLYNDSLNFFYCSHEIRKEAWRNIYAEKFENAALVCWEKDDMEGYRRNLESAMKARGLDIPDPPKVPEEFFDRRIIIYQMDPKLVGLPRVNRHELAGFIDKLDLNEAEKVKLQQDSGLITIDLFGSEDDEDQPEP
ncbi:MAG: hypothetical protein AB9842_07830 [Bacteroidales bacterium]